MIAKLIVHGDNREQALQRWRWRWTTMPSSASTTT